MFLETEPPSNPGHINRDSEIGSVGANFKVGQQLSLAARTSCSVLLSIPNTSCVV